jgi:hypothetical protein
VVRMRLHAATCSACPIRQARTWAKSAPHQLTVRPQVHREAIRAARHRQEAADFTAQYVARAGVEGPHAQGIRCCGLRQPRDVGLAKTHLRHVITAVALDVVRLGAWRLGTPPTKTRCSLFATLRGSLPKMTSQPHSPRISVLRRCAWARAVARRRTPSRMAGIGTDAYPSSSTRCSDGSIP